MNVDEAGNKWLYFSKKNIRIKAYLWNYCTAEIS